MWPIPRPKLERDERALAIATEYILLLGVSLLIFTAIFIGFGSFGNTASADATSESAYRVMTHVSERISGSVESGASVSEEIDIPEMICGKPYVIYPSRNGRAISVLIGNSEYEAPVVIPYGVSVEGFMISEPDAHRIDFDSISGTVRLA